MRPTRGARAFIAAALCLAGLAVRAHAEFFPVVENGPSSNRVNAFFLGDGYTAADIAAGAYASHVQNFVSYMFSNTRNSDPFFRYRKFFNVYRVNVVSAQSGADEPQNGVTKNTALDASYRFDGATDRLLYVSNSKADAALNAAIAGSGKPVNMRFVSVNDAIYGGGGGRYAVFAGPNSSAREVAMHEMGHSFSGLSDEYGGNVGVYPSGEPSSTNLTRNSTGAKWSRWLGYQDPSGGVVGAYEGGGGYDRGVYRPTADSKMRSLGVPFNAIAREKIILDIYNIVRPLDSFTPNFQTLIDPASLSVARVDDSVITTQWFIDGILQPALTGLSAINVAGLGLSRGAYALRVRAFDPTGFDPVAGWVRMNNSRLEQFVNWNISITVPEPATVILLLAGCGAWVWLVRLVPDSAGRGGRR